MTIIRIVIINEPLLKAIDKASRALKTTRSVIICDAVELALCRQNIEAAELRHAQGYAGKPVKTGEFDVWIKEQDWRRANTSDQNMMRLPDNL